MKTGLLENFIGIRMVVGGTKECKTGCTLYNVLYSISFRFSFNYVMQGPPDYIQINSV